MIKMSQKGEYVEFKRFERKIESPFIIYADFERILVLNDNGKQNPEESYAKQYQKQVVCSYSYKLVCANGKFNNPFMSYLGEDTVYNINMVGESKYCANIMKKTF